MFYTGYQLSYILIYIPVVSILNWYIYPLAIRYLKQDVNVITTVWVLAMKVAYLYLSWLAAVIFILLPLPMLSSMVSLQRDGTVLCWPTWKKDCNRLKPCILSTRIVSHFRSVCIIFTFWLNIYFFLFFSSNCKWLCSVAKCLLR